MRVTRPISPLVGSQGSERPLADLALSVDGSSWSPSHWTVQPSQALWCQVPVLVHYIHHSSLSPWIELQVRGRGVR